MLKGNYTIISKRFDKIGHCGQHIFWKVKILSTGKIMDNVCSQCLEELTR